MLQPLSSERPVIVYIDFKSPYAYLAVEPTRELERELGIKFDWRPFVLDIPSYLGSASLDDSGKVTEQERSAEQWAGVKYAYYDCRRYANLSRKTIRGTVKIWDTNLVSTAMLWARQSGDDVVQRFVDLVYQPFWKRELEIDNQTVITRVLEEAGADGPGFLEWAQDEGLQMNRLFQEQAFKAGIYGVPTYVVEQEKYFGREHLARVRWHLDGKSEPVPDIANPLPANSQIEPIRPQKIIVGVDDSMDSLLAVPKIRALSEACGVPVDWIQVKTKEPEALPSYEDQSRAARHKHLRADTLAQNIRRYSPQGLTGEMASAISRELERLNIRLETDGPKDITHPPMPGIVIKLDDELFIGRQHLPLISKLLPPV